jgi:hypothetical protein
MPRDERDELARRARRWADAAWAQGWHAHAIDVLDRAIRVDPRGYKLYRKRGAFYLVCPDATVRDTVQGIADLLKACELSGWEEEVARWVADLLTEYGYKAEAREVLWEFGEHGRKSAGRSGS